MITLTPGEVPLARWADIHAGAAARLAPGAELPVSVLTTMLGVPCVAILMAKGGKRRG